MDADDRSFGEIWLGDLLRALAETDVGSERERAAWAVELLGIAPGAMRLAAPHEPEEPESDHSALGADTPLRSTTNGAPPKVTGRRRSGGHIPCAIVRQSSPPATAIGTPFWYAEAAEIEPATPAHIEARPRFNPLFHPGTTRALLSTALATPSAQGEIDLREIIDTIVRLRPLSALPRRRQPSLRLGIQLLVDHGEGMRPFARDRRQLLAAIRSVVGSDRMELLVFARDPLGGVNRGERLGKPIVHEHPPACTPVVVLSDLGLASRGSSRFAAILDAWHRFADLMRAAQCPVLALTPYAARRVPGSLRKKMHVLTWDRETTVSTVRRLIGRGLEAAQ